MGLIMIFWGLAFGFSGYVTYYHYEYDRSGVSPRDNNVDHVVPCGSPFTPNFVWFRVPDASNDHWTSRPIVTRRCESRLATRRNISGAAGIAGLALVGFGIHFSRKRDNEHSSRAEVDDGEKVTR